MDKLQKQIAQLTARVEKLAVKPKQRKRAKRAPMDTTSSDGVKLGRSRRRRNKPSSLGDGEIRLKRKELVTSLVVKAGKSNASGHVDLLPSSFKFLAGLYTSFERVKYHKLHVFYRSAVGTTQGGMVTYAIDWTLDVGDKDRVALSSYTPNMSHAVWHNPAPLVLPPSRLQSRQWYINTVDGDITDKGPGRVLWAVDAGATNVDLVVGELWVDYDVTMSGTKS